MTTTDDLMTVRDAAAAHDITLVGDDGQPFHCGQRMTTRSGLMGTDYAACTLCGGALVNVMSPHINGGYIPSDEWLAEHGETPLHDVPCWTWVPDGSDEVPTTETTT